ncbi:condensation domain-containing protein, partial [Gordonia sp. NPDC058843]|uniref:condensation domain-containing protein n=1 Tax=Gordonia sp. NPDC058843 TaxID=3346648 RepID=UPI0036BA78C0
MESVGVVRPALVAGVRPSLVPLSFAQQRMWFLNQFEDGAPTYNMPAAFRLCGALDVAALQAAIDDVIIRHESLRTVVVDVDGMPVQHVLATPDGRHSLLPVDVEPDALGHVLADFARHRFDISTDIPFHAAVFRCGVDDHVLAIVMHHIACDGWSLRPLTRDVLTAYRTRCRGAGPDWDPLPVQYADYAVWQRELLGHESDPDSLMAHQLAYWGEQLDGLPETLALPLDRPRPPVSSYRGDAVDVHIPAPLWAGVTALAAQHNVTASMLLQALTVVLLHRVTGEEDIAVGAPIAGRMDDALDDLVGFFVNTWVLRARVRAGDRFLDVLDQVRRRALDAYSNQDVPFERLVEWINPTRSAAYHPLFQVAMAFQNNLGYHVELEDIVVEELTVTTGTAKFDLDFDIAETFDEHSAQPSATGTLAYATDLFDRSTVERFVAWLLRLTEAVVTDPAVVIGDVDLLDPTERD